MPASEFFKGLTLGRANTLLLLAIAFALAGLAFFTSNSGACLNLPIFLKAPLL